VKRPTRTVRRESVVTHRGRPLVLLVPPTADVILVREKGRRVAYEVDVLSLYSVGAKLHAAKRVAERKAKRGRK
jgi:hypothetical protein